MFKRNADYSHQKGDDDAMPNPGLSVRQHRSHAGNTVFKSGPLFISSRGIGWTSWKKRWFILTQTSLVFFRSDPNAFSQKESEVNLTLGGIDLNNSGSVVVRADKKLLTVFFPDGRDGRAFTLKAETSEDMHEWKSALENALSQAPSATFSMGQNGIFGNDASDMLEGPSEKWRDKCKVKSMVVGRSILRALEDFDGSPSFLEKALRFVEQHGVKVEGILRQAADVDEVRRRVQEYEQGKQEFSLDEDAHVVADCVKHILRELPSPPVPASCCFKLLEAFRRNRGSRVAAMRAVIHNTLPEPNHRLLQRILKMMQIVASHKAENLMSISAVAACMAPLLLHPLLSGDCEMVGDPDICRNSSVQFLQAAAAANHAQAIVMTLLEEFDKVFLAPYFESDGGTGEDLKSPDDKFMEEDQYLAMQSDLDAEDDHGRSFSESSDSCSDVYINKVLEGVDSDLESQKIDKEFSFHDKSLRGYHTPLPQHDSLKISNGLQSRSEKCATIPYIESSETLDFITTATSQKPRQTEATNKSAALSPSSCTRKSAESNEVPEFRRPAIWGRTSAMKNLSLDSNDYSSEDEMVIQKLEMARADLQSKIAKEAKGNAILHENLERRKMALRERRLALEQDVVSLKEQLQKERYLRASLEAGPNIPLGELCIPSALVDKMRGELQRIAFAEADVLNLKQKIADLHSQLNQQRDHEHVSLCESRCVDWLNFNKQHTMKVQHRHVKTGDSAHQCERSLRSEDELHGGNDESVKIDLLHQPKDQPPQKQPVDLSHNSSEVDTNLPEEPLTAGPTSTSKKTNGNDEGTVSTLSALTKLTNRLNNLKERRSLLENDIQSLEMSNIMLPELPRLIGASQWTNTR